MIRALGSRLAKAKVEAPVPQPMSAT